MKSIYWRPQKTSPRVLFAIALFAIVGLVFVQRIESAANMRTRSDELQAATLAQSMMDDIRAERTRRGHVIDTRFDPHQTGMIGGPLSAATSKVANLSAKQVSVNPNFAAAAVRMLREAGVKSGDQVAVGWSGSFPALNVALSAAIETLQLRPIVVASALSSQYGANSDDFLWLDMERVLVDSQRIRFQSSAMSVGGAADRAMNGQHDTIQVVQALQGRTNVPLLATERLQASIDARVKLYTREAVGNRIAAYINVGGGIASMGGARAHNILKPGVNRRIRRVKQMPDCVAKRFALDGTPVIHFGEARTLAEGYGLNTNVESYSQPGEGQFFARKRPSRMLAAILLCSIGLLLHGFVSRDYGYVLLDRVVASFQPSVPRPRLRGVDEAAVSQLML